MLTEGSEQPEDSRVWAVLADFSALASVRPVDFAAVVSVRPASLTRRFFVPPLAFVALVVGIAAVSCHVVNVGHRSARTVEHSPGSVVPSEEYSAAEVAHLTVEPEAQKLYLDLAY